MFYYTTSVQVKILQGTNSSRTKSAMRGKSQSTEPGVHQKQHHQGTITCLATTNVLDIIVRWHVRKNAIERAKEAKEPRDEKIRKITGFHANLKIIHQKKKWKDCWNERARVCRTADDRGANPLAIDEVKDSLNEQPVIHTVNPSWSFDIFIFKGVGRINHMHKCTLCTLENIICNFHCWLSFIFFSKQYSKFKSNAVTFLNDVSRNKDYPIFLPWGLESEFRELIILSGLCSISLMTWWWYLTHKNA